MGTQKSKRSTQSKRDVTPKFDTSKPELEEKTVNNVSLLDE